MVAVRLSQQGTVKLIQDFQDAVGFEGVASERALSTIISLNEAFVRDAEAGVMYCVREGGSPFFLFDLYEGHLESAAEAHHEKGHSWEICEVDCNALERIRHYLDNQGVAFKDDADLIMAATSLAVVFYKYFGAGKDACLHIPVIDRANILSSKRVHIHLKL